MQARFRRADINRAGTLEDVLRFQHEINGVTCFIVEDRLTPAYLLPTPARKVSRWCCTTG